MLLRALLLCSCIALGDGASVELRLGSGRADLVQAEGVRALAASPRALRLTADAYVETPPLSELELRWPGMASVRLAGASAFHVAPSGVLELVQLRSAEIEVRRGTLTIDLGQRRTLEVADCALRVTAASDGALQLEHRGGKALELRGGGRRFLRAGEELRLPARR